VKVHAQIVMLDTIRLSVPPHAPFALLANTLLLEHLLAQIALQDISPILMVQLHVLYALQANILLQVPPHVSTVLQVPTLLLEHLHVLLVKNVQQMNTKVAVHAQQVVILSLVVNVQFVQVHKIQQQVVLLQRTLFVQPRIMQQHLHLHLLLLQNQVLLYLLLHLQNHL
jgi:hypothetical protein